MNRYILMRRLTGPAILLLLGVVALLHQAGLVRFSIFVPLMLILIGVIKLAERALLAQQPMGNFPGTQPFPGQSYPGAPYQGMNVPPTAAPTHDFGNDPEGGK